METILLIVSRKSRVTSTALVVILLVACGNPSDRPAEGSLARPISSVMAEVDAALWAFHAADTAKDAEAVIGLLWPEYYMFVDGARIGYDEVVRGAREFLPSLELFHTDWTDVRITPLGPDAAVASFQFRDSIITMTGELIQSRGPTTFVWHRRDGEWRLVYGDADHYALDP